MGHDTYAGSFYVYAWAEVYATDIFASRFEKDGIFNPATGAAYRKEILAPGGSRDGMDSLKAFLGREPSVESYLNKMKIAESEPQSKELTSTVASKTAMPSMRPALNDVVDGKALANKLKSQTLRFDWNLSPAQYLALAEVAVAGSKEAVNNVVALHKSGAALTVDNCLKPLLESNTEYTSVSLASYFLADVTPDPDVRSACDEAYDKTSKWETEYACNKDLCNALTAFSKTDEAKALTGEYERYLAQKLRKYRRDGLMLDEAVAEQVKELKARIKKLEADYGKNLRDTEIALVCNAEEFNGLSDSFLSAHRQPDGSIKVDGSIKADFDAVMESCKVPETRRKMDALHGSRCNELNTPIIEELVSLRHKKARLLGYETHQDFATEKSMAKSGEVVQAFLTDFKQTMTPLYESDLAVHKKLKAECDGDGEFTESDRVFYSKRVEETQAGLDHKKLKEYFPLGAVTTGLLNICEGVFGLKFERELSMEGAAAWHEDVKAYRVSEAADGKLVGFFYFDLHEREGKIDGDMCLTVQTGCTANGEWQYPVAAVICHFDKSTAECPCPLLSHYEVKRFFHEFGHCMHHTCSEATLDSFAGMMVETDFLEAPSQMFENWCYQPAALRLVSGHFETNEPIPDDQIEVLIQASHIPMPVLSGQPGPAISCTSPALGCICSPASHEPAACPDK